LAQSGAFQAGGENQVSYGILDRRNAMGKTRAERKAELQVEAAQLIEAMLDWVDKTEAPDLTAIEEEVLKLRRKFGQKLVEAALTEQPAVAPLSMPEVSASDASEEEASKPPIPKPDWRAGSPASLLLL
jgi:hypothetical protein